VAETFGLISGGISMLFQPANFGMLLIGVIIGIVAGSIPGLSASNTTAMLLPITLYFTMEGALIFIAAVYMACQYGGAISAVLINTPGAAGAVATTFDGYPLNQQGRGAFACGLALGSSTFGGIAASVTCLLIMKPIAAYALNFGTADLFLLALVGISIIITISESNPIKGGLVGAMGLLVAAMAAEPIMGQPRFTMGFFELYDGIPSIATLCGFFAFSSMIGLVGKEMIASDGLNDAEVGLKGILKGLVHIFRYPITLIRGSLIGLIIGILPGAGVSAAALMAYAQAKTWSKHPETFGTGEPEGVVACECADNGVAAGALVPAFALGIPGSATTAVLLAALALKGVNAGPRVMQDFPHQIYAVFSASLFATLLVMILGVPYTVFVSKISSLKTAYLVPSVLAICMMGSFASRQLMFDSYLFIIFGIMGYIMKSNGFMYSAMTLGIVMGKLAEANFVLSMRLSNGSYGIFFEGGIAIVIWVLLVASLAFPPFKKLYNKRKNAATAA
jgi:putative tricarboxylic transport membrane protein